MRQAAGAAGERGGDVPEHGRLRGRHLRGGQLHGPGAGSAQRAAAEQHSAGRRQPHLDRAAQRPGHAGHRCPCDRADHRSRWRITRHPSPRGHRVRVRGHPGVRRHRRLPCCGPVRIRRAGHQLVGQADRRQRLRHRGDQGPRARRRDAGARGQPEGGHRPRRLARHGRQRCAPGYVARRHRRSGTGRPQADGAVLR